MLASGFALAGGQASLRLAETLPAELEGRDVVVTGVVAHLPQQGLSGLRFRFEVDPGGALAGVPSVIALGWYAGFHEDAALVQPRLALRAGQRWRWDGVDFAVLAPGADDYERALRPNAMSCVLRVAGGGRSVLLPRDIERDQEAVLAAAHGAAQQSDVLVAPHHGSKTSSSAPFLDVVRPKIVVFQAGYRNRFGHPAEEVLGRYRQRGIAIVTSPTYGAWQWRADGAAAGACQREIARRYWHHPMAPPPH